MEHKWNGWGMTSPVAVTTDVRSALEEGGTCALRFETCRFGGRVELLRTIEFYH